MGMSGASMTNGEDKYGFQKMRNEILRQRYLRKDPEGDVVETEDQMIRRVADAIALVEAKYGAADGQVKRYAEEFYESMRCGRFLPNSPALMNAGRPRGMLSACFVLPIEDSIDGMFDTVKHTALIQRAGGAGRPAR